MRKKLYKFKRNVVGVCIGVVVGDVVVGVGVGVGVGDVVVGGGGGGGGGWWMPLRWVVYEVRRRFGCSYCWIFCCCLWLAW